MNPKETARMLRHLAAVARDGDYPILAERRAGRLSLVAVDGHKLVHYELPSEGPDVTVPLDPAAVKPAIVHAPATGTVRVDLDSDGLRLVAARKKGTWNRTVPAMNGDAPSSRPFPPEWRDLFRAESPQIVTAPGGALHAAVAGVICVAAWEIRARDLIGPRCDLIPRDGVTVQASSLDGDAFAERTVPAAFVRGQLPAGGPRWLMFNPVFLARALEPLSGETVRIGLVSETLPAIIEQAAPNGGVHYRALLMPIRA